MGIKLIKKTNEAEHKKFDFSITADDAQKFDFINLNYRLQRFRGWVEDLQARVPDTETPKIYRGAYGSSGFSYYINSNVFDQGGVSFDINSGTNPEKYPKFEGSIYVGGERFRINSIGDLTAKLIEDIAATVKEKA